MWKWIKKIFRLIKNLDKVEKVIKDVKEAFVDKKLTDEEVRLVTEDVIELAKILGFVEEEEVETEQ